MTYFEKELLTRLGELVDEGAISKETAFEAQKHGFDAVLNLVNRAQFERTVYGKM